MMDRGGGGGKRRRRGGRIPLPLEAQALAWPGHSWNQPSLSASKYTTVAPSPPSFCWPGRLRWTMLERRSASRTAVFIAPVP